MCKYFAADRETDQKDPGHSKTETSPLGDITVRCAEGYGSTEVDGFVKNLDNGPSEELLLGARTNTDVSGRSMEAKDNLAPNALGENIWFGRGGLLACWRLRRIVYIEFIFMVRVVDRAGGEGAPANRKVLSGKVRIQECLTLV